MNTVRSVGYGWATLIVAGGGAYYFAKKNINADRQAKAEAERRKRQMHRELEASYTYSSLNPSPPDSVASKSLARPGSRPDADWHQASDDASNPSQEASHDPAPTRHAPEDEQRRAKEKSKYESLEPFRSRKGDRFS